MFFLSPPSTFFINDVQSNEFNASVGGKVDQLVKLRQQPGARSVNEARGPRVEKRRQQQCDHQDVDCTSDNKARLAAF